MRWAFEQLELFAKDPGDDSQRDWTNNWGTEPDNSHSTDPYNDWGNSSSYDGFAGDGVGIGPNRLDD